MKTILLLIISNIFMTVAWYRHLKHMDSALWKMVLVSWLIAFFEYCFQVPANRIGAQAGYSAAQLKVMQEVITLAVFCVYAPLFLDQPMKWNHFVGFGFVLVAVFFVRHEF